MLKSVKPWPLSLMTFHPCVWFIVGVIFILTPSSFPNISMLATLAGEPSSSVDSVWERAVDAARKHDFKRAIVHADDAERLGLTRPLLFYWRGQWNFRVGNVTASLRDFDRYVQLQPDRAKSLWERGITCYYAKAYEAGAKQFEDYQSYHDNDVENAVWRYLCQVQFETREKALAAMLPIKNDTRLPMMEVYRLFRGQSRPANVLELVSNSAAPSDVARRQRFDAHLYLALFFYSQGELAAAKKHIELAVGQYEAGDYMWSVAVQHQKRMEAEARAGLE